jgi:hypothetical protein
MSSRTPNITALTSDYDAIERAIRETSRGRWFLNCYLERNRTAETRLLLDAIARLEAAMRDNGHMVDALQPAEALGKVAEALAEARGDIARMVSPNDVTPLPVPRFSFGSIPRSARAATHAIRDAAEEIEKAAKALRGAGVFQGVARQITEKTEEIMRACVVQEQSIGQMQRVAMLISDIEAEIMAVMDGRGAETSNEIQAQLHQLYEHGELGGVKIPEDVVAELSKALARTAAEIEAEEIIPPESA